MSFDAASAVNVLTATLGGLAVGIERQWSGHASGRHARFGGLRTFTLLGGTSGLGGWCWVNGLAGTSIVLLAGMATLIAISYAAIARHDAEATTEFAGFVVLAAGVLSGVGATRTASAVIAGTLLLLVEKRWLHAVVKQVDDVEMRAGATFLVMAVVVLPLLPEGPFGPLGGIRPRNLWLFVLFLSGLSFAGYIGRRAAGNRGYAIAGLLGGLVSSTNATLSLASVSRREPAAGRSLAAGALGASVVMLPRVLLVSAVLYRALAVATWPIFVAPAIIGIALGLTGLRTSESTSPAVHRADNPLQLAAALKMAAVFQLVMFGVALAQRYFGANGLYLSAGVVGTVDMDAVVLSVAKSVLAGTAIEVTSRALIFGAICNSLSKTLIVLVVGRGSFRPLAAIGLILMALALGAGLYLK